MATYTEFPPRGAELWSYDSLPVVSIGVAQGEPQYEFSRVAGVAPHGEGYLVADGASGEIRLFDRGGLHLRTVGGAGAGPGEFTQLRWMGTARGDTVLAWDLRFRRVTVYDGELRLVDTRPLARNDIYVVQGAFEDGDLLLWPFAGSPVRQVASGQVVEFSSYFAIARPAEPSVIDTILRLPARPAYVTPDETIIRIPFTTDPSAASGRSELWAGNGMTGSLARYDRRGEKILEIALPNGGEISKEHVEAYVARDLERYSGAERAKRARLFREIPSPRKYPSYDRLLVDARDNVWVRSYLGFGDATQEWVVFDEGGEPQGAIELPRQFELRVILGETVLGVWRDEFGVESVRVYRLRKP